MEKIFEDNELYSVRFVCECLHPNHSLDVSIEKCSDGKHIYIEFSERYRAKNLGERFKFAWRALTGGNCADHDIGIRPEDIPDLINTLFRGIVEIV